ncbi:alpha/beta hydrolase [Frondihabitans australicus]|uniref:Alpha/beta hydrolase family protein n=1 Tax=Frondihabitans australicus TaxID=386892 RepID=A0A495IKW3_9MICO|nr:alpha/beta hydrolase [Frondihabitans australicus]RKR76370.1 alpha/beta hydrolase family protein [Frondihabitans australicus]
MSFPPPYGQQPLPERDPRQGDGQQPQPQPPQYGYGTSGGYGYGQQQPGTPYGQNPYGQNPYGQSQDNPWGPPPPRRRRPSRRLIIGLAGALAFVLVAVVGVVSFGLVGSGNDTATAKALEARYTQAIDWQHCSGQYYCGAIEAPLDWSSTSSKSIRIALIEHRPKTGEAKQSIVVNPGGPGGSGVNFVGSSVLNAVDKTIASKYNVVGFDPRGVGYSSAVKCYDAANTDTYLYGILPGAIGSKTWLAAQTKAQKKYGEACKTNTGDLLAHVDTTSSARDMDLIRADLGASKLNYIGYSYGSYLGTIYAGLYPGKVGRFVFDGADDPWYGDASGISDDQTVQQAVGFEDDLKSWMKACLAGSAKAVGSGSCPFTATSVTAGMDDVQAMLAKVQKSPLDNSDGRKLGSATLATAIFSAMYDTSEWPALTKAFAGVQAGDPKAAFALADAYNDRTSSGKYYDNTSDAFLAITCLDDGGDSLSDQKKEFDALKKKAPVLGVYESYGAITCNEWPEKAVAAPAPVTAKGSGPILILGNTGDPATPYAGAKALAKQLDNGHLLTYVGEGHTIYGQGVSCIDTRVDSYLETGKTPAAGIRCTK